MTWSLIIPPGHRLRAKRRVTLDDLHDQLLILYERGSTGRQHVLDAFHEHGLSPRRAGNDQHGDHRQHGRGGPGHFNRAAAAERRGDTRGRRVDVRPLEDPIRPIHSGVLVRRGESPSMPAQRLLTFIKSRL